MLTLTVEMTVETVDDLDLTLKRITAEIADGYRAGTNRNATERYAYRVEGEEELPAYTCERCGMATDDEDDVRFTRDAILCHDCYAEREGEMGDDTSWQ